MSKKKKPAYLLHKSSGRARVRIDGEDIYLGEYGSSESRERYDELVAEWFAKQGNTTGYSMTVDDLVLLFMEYAQEYYRKDGVETSELHCIRQATRPLITLFGKLRIREFGPKALKAVRQQLIDAGIVRKSINIHMGRIRRMFKWAVAEELMPSTVLVALQAVSGLRFGRSAAAESKPVKPVPQAYIDAVRPYVSRQVWAAIELQILTGARPGEVLSMRGRDLNTCGKVWEYVPESHKTQHHGKQRIIYIGPKAQAIVREFLKPDLGAYLFSPTDAQEAVFAAKRAKRVTPMTPSQRARQRMAKPKKQPGERYTICSYRRAIANACRKADRQAHEERPETPSDQTLIPDWHPHQLRHNAATELRRQFGIELARIILGHSSAVTTEIYAEADSAKAREIIGIVG